MKEVRSGKGGGGGRESVVGGVGSGQERDENGELYEEHERAKEI